MGEIVRQTTKHVSSVVVINDYSSDKTSAYARKHGPIVLELSRPSGYSSALLAGLNYGAHNGYTTIVMLDTDGAHDPNEIPIMINQPVSELWRGSVTHPV